MSTLIQIKEFLEPCVQAISSVINIPVTIVDESLVRVCGTGIYETSPGTRHEISGAFFEQIIKSGKADFISDRENNSYCQICNKRDICVTISEVGYPIFYMGKTIGVIGITAFTEIEHEYLLKNYEKVIEFLKYISLLVSSQFQSVEYTNQLKSQLIEITKQNSSSNIVGNSPVLLEKLKVAKQIANSPSTVLITGESGTGKEEMAKYIHSQSERKTGPMITVNCGAIPEQLVESELFGYEGGSFTGARKSGAIGKFELANDGTLFLDEIGELPLPAQTKLLRFLQDHTIVRIGGKKPIPVNCRVIAATNQNLVQMVSENTFREDLYYRLNVIPLEMPPLRERGDDIIILAYEFLNFFNKQLRKTVYGFDPNTEIILREYLWPGNVRELRNVVEYAVNVTDGDIITMFNLPPYLHQKIENFGQKKATLDEMLQMYEKSILESRLEHAKSQDEKLQIAQELGISKATLYRRLAKYNL